MTIEDLPHREQVLGRAFLNRTRVHPSAFWHVLLPGYRIMGAEWAEAVIRAWSK